MLLKGNFEHIPAYLWGYIPMIASKSIRSCFPAPFNGEDEELVAAEAALDELSNAERRLPRRA